MSNAENRINFVEALLSDWIDAGLTTEQMEKIAGLLADVAERCEEQDVPLEDVFSNRCKEANLGSLLLGGVQSVGGKVLDTATGFSRSLMERGVDVSPYLLLGGLTLPLGAGYIGGRMLGELEDDPSETLKSIQDQDLIDTLREHAAIARARNVDRKKHRT